MKRIILPIFLAFFFSVKAQDSADIKADAIKLFVAASLEDNSDIGTAVRPKLEKILETKLFQLVNNTGIASVGYSNFLVSPQLNLYSTEVTEGLMDNFTVITGELTISISRINIKTLVPAAHIATYSYKITGSGANKDAAWVNAISKISSSNVELNNFIKNSKAKIINYYTTHCDDILKEARQAFELKQYSYSISLYFSIPSSVPCYNQAVKESLSVYSAFQNEICQTQLLKLKGLVAIAANTKDTSSNRKYQEAIDVIAEMNPNTDCYKEAMAEMAKIKANFNEIQKREWDLKVKLETAKVDIEKAALREMRKISTTYRPEVLIVK